MPEPRFTINLDDYDSPADVIDALVLEPFMRGDLRWSRSLRLTRVEEAAVLLPADATAELEAVGSKQRTTLSRGEGWILRVRRWSDGTADLVVVASDASVGEAVLEATTRDVVPALPEDDSVVPVGFWHLRSRGPERRERSIATPEWSTIRRNYTASAATGFDALMAVTPESLVGRLLLLHGPPGTGKTTALRALARAWRPWCQFDYILDPERFLGQSGYLMDVALDTDGDGDEPRRWRLVILEDCDEVLRSSAKSESGQSLARLLNITDGLLGQGVDLLIAITTNEPLTSLHPAVVRPGRCVAEVEVGALRPEEARRWLRRPAVIGSEGATLAELFAMEGTLTIVRDQPRPRAAGMYL